MILGISLSHDASAALTDDSGRVLSAIGEERISRTKNHRGIPVDAIRLVLKDAPTNEVITRIVVGSHENLPEEDARRFLADLDDAPSNPRGTAKRVRPGWHSGGRLVDTRSGVEAMIQALTSLVGVGSTGIPIVWQNHHLSHLGTALGIDSTRPRLLLSLDGEGDGESGAVAESDQHELRVLARIPAADSLGLLYSAVTARYNFTPTKHEGKITGLAAFGANSAAVDILRSFVEVRRGIPFIRYPKTFKNRASKLALRHLGLARSSVVTLDEIVDLAAANTVNYADLAYAIQCVLEDSVTEIAEFWLRKTGTQDLALAGGVFSNVRLNERLANLPVTREVTVFPNMGDGGLALGGIWSLLQSENSLSRESLYENMFLSPELDDIDQATLHRLAALYNLRFEPINSDAIATIVAREIASGRVIGWHEGRMEFGPRALGHRSILVDPRYREVVDALNSRLKRTEFMPFAPVVLKEHFTTYFVTCNSTLQPFEYMTMTCRVIDEFQPMLQAVTHVDGTARPQIVDRGQMPNYADIISAFGKETGIYVLVNTSFNTHEEPINCRLEDSVRALSAGAVDLLATPVGFMQRRP